MSDELDAALAWAEKSARVPDHARTLAVAVRSLRGHPEDDCACAISSRHEWFIGFCEERDKRKQAEAALAALKARTCHNCRHKSLAEGDWCGLLWIACDGPYATINLTHYVKCERLGFTCGAWAAKDVAPHKPEHICGASGYAPHLGDTCPACEAFRQAREGA